MLRQERPVVVFDWAIQSSAVKPASNISTRACVWTTYTKSNTYHRLAPGLSRSHLLEMSFGRRKVITTRDEAEAGPHWKKGSKQHSGLERRRDPLETFGRLRPGTRRQQPVDRSKGRLSHPRLGVDHQKPGKNLVDQIGVLTDQPEFENGGQSPIVVRLGPAHPDGREGHEGY